MTKETYKTDEVREIVRYARMIGECKKEMKDMARFPEFAKRDAGAIDKYKGIQNMINQYPEFLCADNDDLRGTIKNMERALANCELQQEIIK